MNHPKSNLSARLFNLGAAAVTILAMAACAPKYYSSNSQNVPLFTEKGQATVSGAINPEANRAEARGAIAVTEAVAVQANAALYFPEDDGNGNGGKGGLFEAGVGFFRPVSERVVFETWGIAAYGGVENHFPGTVDDNPGTDGTINANLVRVAVQPAIGYKIPHFEAALSTRLAMLNYFNVSGNLITSEGNQQDYLRANRQQFLLEPAITLRAGSSSLKGEAQLGFSVNVGDADFPQDENWASVGLVYFFDPTR